MHGDFNAVLKIAKEEISIRCRCIVRQGCNLAPTLFVNVLHLVAENIFEILKIKKGAIPTIVRNNSTSADALKLHKIKDTKIMVLKHANLFMHVDDGDALFNRRKDMISGFNIIYETMTKWGRGSCVFWS